MMANLTIRNLPDDVRDRLRLRAAEHGRSMEAEAREILADATQHPRRKPAVSIADLQSWVAAQTTRGSIGESGSAALIRDRRREAILDAIRQGRDPGAVFGAHYERVLSEASWTEDDVRGLVRSLR